MLSSQIADRLRHARKTLGLTQAELAGRAAVSTRLVAEVERGERDNVSMATMLRLLGEAGLSVSLSDSAYSGASRRGSGERKSTRAMRVAERRATWGGRQLRLAQEGLEDPAAPCGVERLAAVALVSTQAFAVAGSRMVRARAATVHAARTKK
ncbi:MAG: helix-turn-helix domain-containing protein [Gemmatimonadetes bacterium]|nr:helix-turn-helix domain-containing protein [Gemmatimonadota bacterium]